MIDRPRGPLSDVLVVDLTHALSGPYCTLLLTELGARVIKVERAPLGDQGRNFAPFVDGKPVFHQLMNRGKESIALDIGDPADRPVLEEMFRRADVVVENFRPGMLERHGFGYEALRALNPSIVLASITGYGQTGPEHEEGAYDTVIQGAAGIMAINGLPGTGPTRVGCCVADYVSGIYTFGAITTALFDRERRGRGAHIDLGMHDAVLSILDPVITYLGTGAEPEKAGNSSGLAAPFDLFDAADGSVTICAADDASFASLCAALGHEELVTDARYGSPVDRVHAYDTLRPVLASVVAGYTVDELIELLQHASVACGRVNSVGQAIEDAQTNARNMVVDADGLRLLGNPIKMSTAEDPPTRAPAPDLDADGPALRAEFAR
jgi:CoA:oxalate CoA-transferase